MCFLVAETLIFLRRAFPYKAIRVLNAVRQAASGMPWAFAGVVQAAKKKTFESMIPNDVISRNALIFIGFS